MIAPSHLRPQLSAAALFTNRHRAKEQFIAALDGPQGAGQYRVLNWFGLGGQGKTALLEEFERTLHDRNRQSHDEEAPPRGYALIDFENQNNRAIATALLSVRDKLRDTAGLHCPTFEAALLRYFMMTQTGTNLKELRAQFFHTGSEVMDGIIQALNTAGELGATANILPGFGLLSKYGTKLAGNAGHAFYKWWTRRGIRAFTDIDSLSQDALLRRLPAYLGADLMEALSGKNPPRVVIMFDTYEALWRGHGLKDSTGMLRIDDWVRLLVQDSPGALFIIAGRDKLRWSEVDPDWSSVVQTHLLGGLTRPDAVTLLSRLQVSEPELQAPIIKGARSREFGEINPADDTTEAYLPFYLVLQAETYHDIKASGEIPEPDKFGGDHPLILARFLEHLDAEADKLLRLASYPVAIDAALLDMLAEQFLGGRAHADWSRIYSRSVVSEEKDGTQSLHDLLRQALQERERRDRPELYRDIHRNLFTWFAARCDEDNPTVMTDEYDRCFIAALRHLSRLDEGEAVRWSNDQMERFDAAARWRALEEACTIVLPIAERAFGGEDEWTTANLLWLARVYSNTGRYAEAERLFLQVRAVDERTFGPEHSSFATTLHNLAGVYRDTGRYAEAERLFLQVRAIEEKTLGPEHPSFATTLHNLAGVYRDTGCYAEAERLFLQVRAIYEKTLGPEHSSFATTLHNLAGVYRDTGRYAEAERLFLQVRAIEEKTLGPEHPSFATTLGNLAGVYSDTGRYAEAERLFLQVRAIEEKTLGPEHPSFATTLGNLARVYSETDRYAEAERLFLQVRAIYEKTLGPEHSSFATTLHNLAGVYRDTGRYAEAERLFLQVRAIEEKTLGPEHPSFATTLVNLARVYSETNRYGEAEQLLSQAMNVYSSKLPQRHFWIARLLIARGRLHTRVNRSKEAHSDFQEAVTMFAAAGVQPEYRWMREAREGLNL